MDHRAGVGVVDGFGDLTQDLKRAGARQAEVTVNGIGGTSDSDNLVVRIVDDTPTALNDGPTGVTEDGTATIVLLTHIVREKHLQAALREITAQSTTKQIGIVLRVLS